MSRMFAIGTLAFGLSLGFASAAAAQASMPTTGLTSQPIGHYEFCKRYPGECGPTGSTDVASMTGAVRDTLQSVNRAVNEGIIARTDREIYGQDEYWTYPEVQGDCEDFALLKQYMLEQRGIPASALVITVLRQSNGDGHAVLTVRTDRGDFILDNLDDEIRRWDDTDYTYLKRQAAVDHGRWVGIEDSREILVGSVR